MVYIHVAFFICPSVSAKNRPGFLSQKPGALFALLVLSQALTQNLAGVLDRSLSGCQNYRAFLSERLRLLCQKIPDTLCSRPRNNYIRLNSALVHAIPF